MFHYHDAIWCWFFPPLCLVTSSASIPQLTYVGIATGLLSFFLLDWFSTSILAWWSTSGFGNSLPLDWTVLEILSDDANMWENICQLSTPLFFNLVYRILFCNCDLFCPKFYDLLWEQGKREKKVSVCSIQNAFLNWKVKSIMHAMLFLGKIYALCM